MSECRACRKSIRGESGIRCAGVCGRIYHCQEKCCGLDKYCLDALDSRKFLKFMCDDCVQYVQNVDDVLKDVQLEVRKSNVLLSEYKAEFQCALKQNEEEMKSLLSAIETRFSERVEAMQTVQDTCTKTIHQIKNCHALNDCFKEQCSAIKNELHINKTENAKILNKLNKAIENKTLHMPKTAVPTFAEALKLKTTAERKKELPVFSKTLPLVIIPKNKQNTENTVKDLNKNINPKDLNIKNVKRRQNGVIVVEANNVTERDTIKHLINEKIGSQYETKVPKAVLPRCLITGLSTKPDENDIIDIIKKQNSWISDAELNLIKIYNVQRNNNIYYNIIIETDSDTFIKLLDYAKINIGWEKCRVFDGINVITCFKCRGFNHKAADCKNDIVCLKCLGNHLSSECEKEQVTKCINCIRANDKLNLGLDINHKTMDRICPVYQNKIDLKKKTIGY